MKCTLRVLFRRMISTDSPELLDVSAFIVSSAKTAYAEGGAEAEEVYLRPAWILTVVSAQVSCCTIL